MALSLTRRCACTVLAVTMTLALFPETDVLAQVKPRPRSAASTQDQQPLYASDRVIVKYRSEAAVAEGPQLHAAVGASVIKHLHLIDADVVAIPADWSVKAALQWYAEQAAVEYVEPDYLQFAVEGLPFETTPTDPRFDELWAMHNTGQTGGTADADIDAPEAWDLTTGSSAIVVGVIDEGIDVGHPDLAANVWVNEDEIPDNDIDDDGNGYVDDVNGWDFYHNDNSVYDGYSYDRHGTHVAGTIGAVAENDEGVTGVAWQVKIMALKFLGPSGGYTSDAIEAIEYAVDNGATLTTNSWGGGGFSTSLQAAIQASGDAGMLFVAAAGNSARDNDISPHYPSSYPLDNIISVAATDDDDELALFSTWGSNWGLTSVDLAAPGVDILSTLPNTQYESYSGTSMATPHVTGVAVLVHSAYPELSHLEVKTRIIFGGDPIDAVAGKTVTGRRLNANNALEDDDTPPGAVTDLTVMAETLGLNTPMARTSLALEWTSSGDDGAIGTAAGYDLRYSTNPIIDEATFDAAFQATGLPNPSVAGTVESFTVSGLDPMTQYHFALRTVDNVGNLSGLSNSASGSTDDVDVIFEDDAETEASEDLWTADAPWARTTEDASPDGAPAPLSGSYSWTDSPGGDYARNIEVNLTSIVFSLEEATNSALQFDHRYDFESGWDYGFVEVSDDGGSSWAPLGAYTGTQDLWTSETFDLSEWEGEPSVQIRFQVNTDATYVEDGWYIDDVRIIADVPTYLTIVDSLNESRDTAIVALELVNPTPVAGVNYQIQWDDPSDRLAYEESDVTDRTTGFTHDLVFDSDASLLTGILVEPGGGIIDAGSGAIVEHRMAVTLPPDPENLPPSSVEVDAPDDPREGLPRIFIPIPFTLLDLAVSDEVGNPVPTVGYHGAVDIEFLNGDVDFSGAVDVSDVVATVDYFLDQATFTDFQFLVADAFLDTVINVIDIVREINIILGRQIGTGAAEAASGAERAAGREETRRGEFNVALRRGEGIAGARDRNVAELVAEVPPGVVALQVNIQFDSSRVGISGARALIEDDGFQMSHRIRSNSASFMLYNPGNTPLPAGSRPVIELELDARGANSTESGLGTIQLVEVLGVDAAGVPVYPSLDPALAIQELLGNPRLTPAQKRQLDSQGNRDGSFDLGDLLAFMQRSGMLTRSDVLAKPDTSRTPNRERRQ